MCRKAQELPHEGRATEQGRIQEVHEARAVRLHHLQVLQDPQPHPLHQVSQTAIST